MSRDGSREAGCLLAASLQGMRVDILGVLDAETPTVVFPWTAAGTYSLDLAQPAHRVMARAARRTLQGVRFGANHATQPTPY